MAHIISHLPILLEMLLQMPNSRRHKQSMNVRFYFDYV
jgi:hypothetical protein